MYWWLFRLECYVHIPGQFIKYQDSLNSSKSMKENWANNLFWANSCKNREFCLKEKKMVYLLQSFFVTFNYGSTKLTYLVCQIILGAMGGGKNWDIFLTFSFFFTEESPNNMHGYFHCLGCLGPSGYSSLCLHDNWRMELHWRPLFLIHHYHHHRIWRFCCWSVIVFYVLFHYMHSGVILLPNLILKAFPAHFAG